MKRIFKFFVFVLVVTALAQFVLRRIRQSHGRFRGRVYRTLGRHPSDDVNDLTLADRVRSELGPIEKHLDVPRVHVMVQDHVAVLHGDVEWPHEAATIVETARKVAGVRDVESHLHLGLLASDTRPSEGRHHAV